MPITFWKGIRNRTRSHMPHERSALGIETTKHTHKHTSIDRFGRAERETKHTHLFMVAIISKETLFFPYRKCYLLVTQCDTRMMMKTEPPTRAPKQSEANLLLCQFSKYGN